MLIELLQKPRIFTFHGVWDLHDICGNWVHFIADRSTRLRSSPELKAAVIADSGGSVWALFTDKRGLIIADNRLPAGITPVVDAKSQDRAIITDPIHLRPGSSHASLLNAIGNCYLNPVPLLSSLLFSARGDTPSRRGRARSITS